MHEWRTADGKHEGSWSSPPVVFSYPTAHFRWVKYVGNTLGKGGGKSMACSYLHVFSTRLANDL